MGGDVGAVGDFGAVFGVDELLGERRQVVLAVGVDDVRRQLRALVDEETAPPQEIAKSLAKISCPGSGSAGTCPKTSSRNTEPKEITSIAAILVTMRIGPAGPG